MKTKYILESVKELKSCQEATTGNVMPETTLYISGELQVTTLPTRHHCVELTNDPVYEFSMPFKQFVLELAEMAGLDLKSRDNIPD